MKENELMEFMQSLWRRGLITKSPDEFDYEWVIWDYLKLRQQAHIDMKSGCTHEWDEKSHNVYKCKKCGKYNC